MLIAFVVVLGIGVAVLLTGRPLMAAWFGFAPAAMLALFGMGNQFMLRHVDRKVAESCSVAPELRDLSDPRATPRHD